MLTLMEQEEIFSCDYHVHSEFSPCSEDMNIKEIAKISKDKNIQVTITDHSYVFYMNDISKFSERGVEKTLDRKRAMAKIEKYIENMRKFDINIGSELDILPSGEILFEKDFYDELYVRLGAIHSLDSICRKRSNNEIIEEFKRQNTIFINSGVDIIAHPFRILESNGIYVDESLISWLVKQAYPTAALEVNAHKRIPETDVKMVRKCYEFGTKISIGTDSHRMSELLDFSYHKKVLLNSRINDIGELVFRKEN